MPRLLHHISAHYQLSDIYNSVSSHYLHFSDCDKVSEDVLEYIAKQGIEDDLKSPSSFRSFMEAKFGDYFSGKPFAPSEVCCGIRLAVERLSYETLAAEDKPGFLDINTGTEDRFLYASEHGVEVPETFHLLGSIYKIQKLHASLREARGNRACPKRARE